MPIQIKKVNARQFRKILNSGKTTPLSFECAEITADLETVLDQFAEISDDLKKE